MRAHKQLHESPTIKLSLLPFDAVLFELSSLRMPNIELSGYKDGKWIHPDADDIKADTIHQIWMQGAEHLKLNRPYFYDNIERFRVMNGGKHHLWSENQIRSLMAKEYPQLIPTYDSYEHFILRVDLAKYIILHYYGGFYVDADTECQQSFYGLIKLCNKYGNKPLICKITKDPRVKAYSFISWKREFVNNHFFYFPAPKHGLCKVMLDQAPKHAKRWMLEAFSLYVLRAIGPGFVMNCIDIYKSKLQSENKGVKIQRTSFLTILDSKLVDEYFTHQSKNTWLEHSKCHSFLQYFVE